MAITAVHVLLITHDSGTDVYPCRTEKGASERLAAWVRDWWHEIEDKAGPIPDDINIAVERFFEINEDETWEVVHTGFYD